MRKFLVFIFVITSVLGKAEWFKGKVVLANGEVKEGYVKDFESIEEPRVVFRETPEAPKQKFKSDDLREVMWINEKGEKVRAMRLKLGEIKNHEGKLKISKEKYWMGVIYDGDFRIVSYKIAGGGNHMIQHCIQWDNDDYATICAIQGLVFARKKFIRDVGVHVFKGRCDKLVEALTDKTFEPNKIDQIIEFWEKNCSTSGASGN